MTDEKELSASLKSTKQYIYSFDLSPIIEKLVSREGWIKSDAVETSIIYRNYLFLIKKYGNVVPSQDVDEFWHQHILDTKKYMNDCFSIYGKYLHHSPFSESESSETTQANKELFEKTQALYYKEFGSFIRPTKSAYPKPLYFLMKKTNLFY